MSNAFGKLFPVENSKEYQIKQMEATANYVTQTDTAAIIGASAIICTGAVIVSKAVGRIVNHFIPPKHITLTVVPKKERLKKLDEEA